MSCFHVSERARLKVCSSRALSRLRTLFRVGAWCSDPGTHVLSFGFHVGVRTLAFHFLSLCECAVSSSLDCALSCLCVFCCVARSSCFYRLLAFMLYLVLCGTQLVYFIGCVHSCCHVLCEHVAYEFSH